MKLKYTLKKTDFDGQIVAVPVDAVEGQYSGVLTVNKTGAFILDLLKNDTSIDKMVQDILAEYSGDEQTIRGYVERFVANLEEKGLLA